MFIGQYQLFIAATHNINMTTSMSSNHVSREVTIATKESLGSSNDESGDKGEFYIL